jgi:hypothetical protein
MDEIKVELEKKFVGKERIWREKTEKKKNSSPAQVTVP